MHRWIVILYNFAASGLQCAKQIPFLLEIVVPFLLRKRAHFKRRSIQEIILYLLSAVGARLARRHLESMTQLKTSRHPDSAALMDVLDRLRKCEFIPDMQVEPMEATDLASISESSSTMRRCSDFVDPQVRTLDSLLLMVSGRAYGR